MTRYCYRCEAPRTDSDPGLDCIACKARTPLRDALDAFRAEPDPRDAELASLRAENAQLKMDLHRACGEHRHTMLVMDGMAEEIAALKSALAAREADDLVGADAEAWLDEMSKPVVVPAEVRDILMESLRTDAESAGLNTNAYPWKAAMLWLASTAESAPAYRTLTAAEIAAVPAEARAWGDAIGARFHAIERPAEGAPDTTSADERGGGERG